MTRTHDHEIVIGSTTRRLTLARDEKGKALYDVTENTPSYYTKDDINTTIFEQKDWSGGHGQYWLDEEAMYFDGQSIDTTQDGRVILGPLIQEAYATATLDQSLTVAKTLYGFISSTTWVAQTFTAGSSYTLGSVVLNLSKIPGYTGNAYVKIKAVDGTGKPTGADLALGVITPSEIPLYATFSWVTCDFSSPVALTSGTKYAIIVKGGSSSPYLCWAYKDGSGSDPYAGGSTYATTDSGATWAAGTVNVDYLFKTYTVAATALDSQPFCFLWSSALSKLFCATLGKVYYYSGAYWTAATTTLAGVTDLKEFDGILYAAMGSTTKYYYSSDGDVWYQTDLSDGYAVKFLSAPNPEGTANVLWKTKLPNQVANTTDGRCITSGGTATNLTGTMTGSPVALVAGANTPTVTVAGTFTIALKPGVSGTVETGGWTVTGSPVTLTTGGSTTITVEAGGTGTITITLTCPGVQWTSPAYIGDTSNNITNIFLDSDRLMVGRTDNLYHYNSEGGISALLDDLKTSRTTQNFKYVVNWQGDTYFSLDNDMGNIISGAAFNKMGPLHDTRDIDKVGTIVGMTSDTDYLYVAVLEDTITHIYKGQYKNNQWSWCPFVYLGTNYCETIYISQHSVTDKRLWFGYGTHTGFVNLSTNPTADDTYRFCPTGWLRMSYLYGTHPYWDKMIQYVVSETAGCTANITVTPKYRKDTDTSDSALTGAIVSNGTLKTNLTSALSGKRFQFGLWLATNDSTITPQVLRFEVHGQDKPETLRIHSCTYLLSDTPELKGSTIRAFLRGGRTSTSLIKFADLRWGEYTTGTAGTNYQYVIMAPGYPREVEVYQEKGKPPELGIEVKWQETNFS